MAHDIMSANRYCTDMVTAERPRAYLYIAERMAALDPPLKDAAVAELCNVKRETVVRWRQPLEQHRINAGKMLRLADALQCEVPDLFLPPGQVAIAVDIAGAVAKRGNYEKPLDSRPVRRLKRVRQ